LFDLQNYVIYFVETPTVYCSFPGPRTYTLSDFMSVCDLSRFLTKPVPANSLDKKTREECQWNCVDDKPYWQKL